MEQQELIPHLFRTEYSKIVAVLCKYFGPDGIQAAEDIAADTFLAAAETWGIRGAPANPAAWLYMVAKNKTKNYLQRMSLFDGKIARDLKHGLSEVYDAEPDLSPQNITDSQLQMMFVLCHPGIPVAAQAGLSLRILCGFGIEEIADAFLSNKETINKRLTRAKDKLRALKPEVALPSQLQMNSRLEGVLTTLYLLFNEGYYSISSNNTLRKDLCLEAMRLCHMLTLHEATSRPEVHALLALMCFHASRFEARVNDRGELILYADQDTALWDHELIGRGTHHLNSAANGDRLSRYHAEAAIAWWHTQKTDSPEKWENILQLYNLLLQLDYSPVAALNRTYALSRTKGKSAAIAEAEKLKMTDNHFYYTLLGTLYSDLDNDRAKAHFRQALILAKTPADRQSIQHKIDQLA